MWSWYWVGEFPGHPLDGAGGPGQLGKGSTSFGGQAQALCKLFVVPRELMPLFMGQKPWSGEGAVRQEADGRGGEGGESSQAFWGTHSLRHPGSHRRSQMHRLYMRNQDV